VEEVLLGSQLTGEHLKKKSKIKRMITIRKRIKSRIKLKIRTTNQGHAAT